MSVQVESGFHLAFLSRPRPCRKSGHPESDLFPCPHPWFVSTTCTCRLTYCLTIPDERLRCRKRSDCFCCCVAGGPARFSFRATLGFRGADHLSHLNVSLSKSGSGCKSKDEAVHPHPPAPRKFKCSRSGFRDSRVDSLPFPSRNLVPLCPVCRFLLSHTSSGRSCQPGMVDDGSAFAARRRMW